MKLLQFSLLSILITVGLLAITNIATAQTYGDEPLAHTYSIVAIDEETGEMGVAVQSNWFSVGTLVAWGEAGVGVVATQSFVNPSFGPRGLSLLQNGLTAEMALAALLELDEGKAVRQVAILDASGNVAAHTGDKCIEAAGHKIGATYSVQANLMEKATVWPAMAKAFEDSKGQPLAERMLAALQAAQAEGGDIRGKQSAALLVVGAENTGQPWVDRKVDIRVDDHKEPIKELGRLLKTHRAYQHMNAGDLAVEHGDMELAMEEYGKAEEMFPENMEMKFWHAVALANTGSVQESLPLFREVFSANAKWKELVPRLVPSGLLTVSEEDIKLIQKQ
jgi:uncharacterized Ntn-hydrolase superfamily protein